jgi:uncharacterized membrane protein YebE (DUF533 family)
MFDAKSLLNEVLGQAKTLAGQGSDLATRKLGVPAAGPEKDSMMKGLGTGAIGGVVLGLLLGTKSGRKLGGGALKLGSLAALGTIAFKAYQGWQAKQSGGSAPAESAPAAALPAPEQGASADPVLLLRAMVAAANSDGHIDAEEKARITDQLGKLGLGAAAASLIEREVSHPLDPKALAALVPNEQQAVEVYALSVAVVGEQTASEKAYLGQLAAALKLAPELIQEIESQLTA